jgi:hypothetical protein
MIHAKIFGLLVLVATALMVLAGSASATMTEAAGDPVDVGDTTHASSEGAVSFTGSLNITCQKSTVSGEVITNDGNIDEIELNGLTFEECGNHTVTTIVAGRHVTHKISTHRYTTTSTGARITALAHLPFSITTHCIYTTNAGDVGEVTDYFLFPAKIHTKGNLSREVTDFGCGSETSVEGTYIITAPSELLLD